MRADSALVALVLSVLLSCETPSKPAVPASAGSESGARDLDPSAGTPTEADAAAPGAAEPSSDTDRVDRTGADPETAALEARVRELEAALAAAHAAKAAGGGLAGVDELMAILERRNGPAMLRAMEPLLRAGEPGWKVLHDFFHAADVDHEKILLLTHDPQLLFAQLNLVARYPEEVAALSRYLMRVTRDRPASYIRREIFNFVPVLINHHPGRFLELRAALEEEILFQLETGGDYLYKVSLAMRDLDFYPPPESYLPVLRDASKAQSYASAVELIAQQGDEGIRVLADFLRDYAGSDLASLAYALRAVAASESSGALMREFLASPEPSLRDLAHTIYFSSTRGEESLPLARDFLASDADLRRKRAFVGLLRRTSPELIERISKDPSGLPADVQAVLERLRDRDTRAARGASDAGDAGKEDS